MNDRLGDRLIVRGAREHNLQGRRPRPAPRRADRVHRAVRLRQVAAWPSTRSSPRASAATSSRCPPTPGSSSARWTSRTSTSSRACRRRCRSTRSRPRRNPRSTVGTITEVYDYLRLLYARIGQPHCPICGEPIAKQTPQQIVDRVLEMPEGTRFQVLAPVIRERKGEYVDLFADLQAKGYARARVDGVVHPLTEPPKLKKQEKHTIEVVVDRLVDPADQPSSGSPTRWRPRCGLAGGVVILDFVDLRRGRPAPRAALLRAAGLPERPPAGHRRARAAVVLVQLAVRRLPGVHRPRHPQGGRPRAGRPRPGAAPWASGAIAAVGRRADQRVLPAAAAGPGRRRRASTMDTPWERAAGRAPRRRSCTASDEQVHVTLPQPVRPASARTTPSFEGVVPWIERRHAETDRDYGAGEVRGLHARGAVPGLRRAPGSSRRSSRSPIGTGRSHRRAVARCRSARRPTVLRRPDARPSGSR